jgi:hypothetical protein
MADPCIAPTFAPRSGLDCFFRAIVLILAAVPLLLFSCIPSIHCLLLQVLFELRVCRRGNQDQAIDLRFDPNEWLAQNQFIGAATVWQETNGELRPHSRWTTEEKKNLYDSYWHARLDEETGIPEAPAAASPETAGLADGTWYPRDLAWQCFIAHVGQSIAVENARWVSWSLTTFSGEQLAMLLDSRSLFFWDSTRRRYGINILVQGAVTPGDPVRVFRFLRGLGLTGATSREAIERLLDWCRSNLLHFFYMLSIENNLNHWGYSGYPPVERIISGTLREHPADRGHFTAGCHGTVGFLLAVLRTANIPVERLEACRHAQPHFVREDLFLSHGDDPYGRIALSRPLPAAGEMLINRATYEGWFGSAVPADRQCLNLDRRMTELALRTPNSDFLLSLRCDDLARGRSNADSRVYEMFRGSYSLAELDAMSLWPRLDDEIARRGGCAGIPG